jgi:hypothetical protein
MYQKQIEQLVMLQSIDGEMITLTAELRNAPLEIQGLEQKNAEIEQSMALVKDKLGYLENQLTRLESENEEDHVRMRKSKSKMMAVGNSKEYHAMVREMDNLEKQTRVRDEERTALREELDRQVKAEADMAEQVTAINQELEQARAGLTERMEKAQKRLDHLSVSRKSACKALPPPILSRYEFIRSRLANPVIVPVDNGVCSGCNISIPPQSYIELQKGQQILSCPNCQRLIYWAQHVQPDEPEVQATAAGSRG